jgi:hypothetical protein
VGGQAVPPVLLVAQADLARWAIKHLGEVIALGQRLPHNLREWAHRRFGHSSLEVRQHLTCTPHPSELDYVRNPNVWHTTSGDLS